MTAAKNEISFQLNYEVQKVQLTDVFGKQIDFTLSNSDNNNYKINFNSSLANGVYFISIHTSNGIVNTKFVKE